MKNSEVNDFIEVGDEDEIEDKAILEFFIEQSDVSFFFLFVAVDSCTFTYVHRNQKRSKHPFLSQAVQL